MTCDSEDTATKRGSKRRLGEAKWADLLGSPHAGRSSSEAKRARKMEIETEFRILKSLIPNIANKQQINELEIIDACVNYIEALQDQLNIRQNRSPSQAASPNDMSEEVDSVGDHLEAADDDENDENEAANGRQQQQLWAAAAATASGSLDSESDDMSEDDDSESDDDSDVEEENNNASKKTENLTTDVATTENEEESSSSLQKSSETTNPSS